MTAHMIIHGKKMMVRRQQFFCPEDQIAADTIALFVKASVMFLGGNPDLTLADKAAELFEGEVTSFTPTEEVDPDVVY